MPWFKGRYGVHVEVHGKEEEKGENGDRNRDGNGEIGPAGTERGRELRKGEAGVSGEGKGVRLKGVRWWIIFGVPGVL